MATTDTALSNSPIGRDTPRVDGPRKVTGLAQYTSDFHFPGTLYAVPVEATIANGKTKRERMKTPSRTTQGHTRGTQGCIATLKGALDQ